MDILLAELISGDDARAEAAMHKLVAQGAKAVPALRVLAASPDPDQRWWAVSTLAQMDDVDVDLLLNALEDDAIEVQQAAVLGLTDHPHPKAVSALVSLLPGSNGLLRRLVTNALSALGKDATPALLTFLCEHKAQDAARLSAIRALANIGDHQAIPALMAALEEESALIRH